MANNALIIVFEWCKEQRVSLQRQLDLIESGRVRFGEHHGAGWRDVTRDTVATVRKNIAELDRIFAAYDAERYEMRR